MKIPSESKYLVTYRRPGDAKVEDVTSWFQSSEVRDGSERLKAGAPQAKRTSAAGGIPPTSQLRPGANFSLVPSNPQPGRWATASLQLMGRDGKPVSELETLHTKPVHLIAVSEDLTDFIHVHPVSKGGGKFEVPLKFNLPSRYRVWAEYQPKGTSSAVLDVSDASTIGARAAPPTLMVDSAKPKTIDSTKVALHGAEALKAGREANLHFEFADALSGQPAELSPLLGAAGHAIVISSDRAEFMHLHGMGEGDAPAAPNGGGHRGHNMAGTGSAQKTSKVTFAARFPSPGTYRVFCQVNRGGETLTVPFTVAVS